MLHTRVVTKHHTWDIVNAYQVPWKRDSPEQQNLAYRRPLWNELHKLLSALPNRNRLVVGGDLNTVMPHSERVTGHQPVATTRPETDAHKFLDIAERQGLVCLNTWHGPNPTFTSVQGDSLIDYLLVRRSQAQGRAKQAKVISTPVGQWRGGGRHHPVLAHLVPCTWQLRRRRVPLKPWNEDSLIWHEQQDSQLYHTWRNDVQAHLSQIPPCDRAQVDTMMCQLAAVYFPTTRSGRQPGVWQSQSTQMGLQALWTMRKQLQGLRRGTLRECVRYWRLAARTQYHARSCQRVCRAARKHRTLALLHDAEEAARQGQARHLYQIVRQLAPKQAFARMQLRGEQGQLLDEQEGLQALLRYSHNTFARDSTVLAADPVAFHLTQQELANAFAQLKGRKAVPPRAAPISAYKFVGDLVSAHLHGGIGQATTQAQLPCPWTHSSMTWIPKPSKPPTKPESLRPLNLMGAEAKAIAIAIRERLQPYAEKYMEDIPQFAFLQGRNSLHCILRVHQHCREVRTGISAFTSNLHRLRNSRTPKKNECFGAFQIALDLSKAFDTLARHHIQTALKEAGAPGDLISITMRLLTQTSYVIQVGDCSDRVRTTNGIRQGCPLSPLLWTLATGSIWRQLSRRLDPSVLRGLTLFADDHHLSFTFSSVKEFHRSLQNTGQFLAALQDMGLQVNPQKSVAVAEVRGVALRKALKQATVRTAQQSCLRIPMPSPVGPPVVIPLHPQAMYLGVIVSYRQFEDATVKRNISRAKQRYGQLRRVLTTRSVLHPVHRLRLWRACLESVFLYGLPAVGVTPHGLHLLQVSMTKQIRAVLRSPVHITHESNQALWHRTGLTETGSLLAHRCLSLQDRLQQHGLHKPSTAAINKAEIRQAISSVWALLESTLARAAATPPRPTTALFRCDLCERVFDTAKGLKAHRRLAHQVQERSTLSARSCSVDGMPTCRYCNTSFSQWQVMEHHVKHLACQGLKDHAEALQPTRLLWPHTQEPLPLPATEANRLTLLSPKWPGVLDDDTVRRRLNHHCLLCNQWVATPARLKLHWRRLHPQEWQAVQGEAHSLLRTVAQRFVRPLAQTCSACQCPVTRNPRHHASRCAVVFQVAAARCLLRSHVIPTVEATSQEHGHRAERPGCGHAVGGNVGRTILDYFGPHGPGSEAAQGPSGRSRRESRAPPGQREGTWTPARSPSAAAGASQPDGGIRASQADSQAGSGPRGLLVHAEGRQRIHSSLLPRHAESHTGADGTVGEVENKDVDRTGTCAGFHPPPRDAVQVCGSGAPQEVQATPRGQGNAAHGDSPGCHRSGGQAQGQGRRSAQVPHAPLGQLHPDHGSGRSQAHHDVQGYGESAPGVDGRGGRVCQRRPVPCDAADAELSVEDSSGSRTQLPCRGSPPDSSRPLRTSHLVPGLRLLEAGSHAAHAAGASSGEKVGGQVERIVDGLEAASPPASSSGPSPEVEGMRFQSWALSIRLANPHSLCYVNSTFLAATHAVGQVAHCEPYDAQPLTSFLRRLITSKHSQILITAHLGQRLTSWPRIAHQHDVAEFYAFFVRKFLPTLTWGTWQSRTSLGGQIRIHDHGQTHQPIALPGTGGRADLLDMIDAWHGQAHLHALASSPSILALQLNRFSTGRRGGAKVHSAYQVLYHTIFMPVFSGHGLNLSQVPYDVVACVIHDGTHSWQGHYRVLLKTSDGWCLRDDARAAKLLDQHAAHALTASRCYMLVYRRQHSSGGITRPEDASAR